MKYTHFFKVAIVVLVLISLYSPVALIAQINSTPAASPANTPKPPVVVSSSPSPLPSTTPVIPLRLGVWAWSSNVGWVDARQIKIDQNTGLLSGYAWSPNIGWIKFDGLSDYPKNGSKSGPAKVDLKTGIFSGWIRACSGTDGGNTKTTGADCRSMDSRMDGWDGWIELSDDANSKDRVRLDLTTGNISGFAWGSSVVGWLKFGSNTNKSALSATCTATANYDGQITFYAKAIGGSGDYWYRWNQIGDFKKSNDKLVLANNGKFSETATLEIIDMNDGSQVQPLCPTINRKGNTIKGVCSINGKVQAAYDLYTNEDITVSLSDVAGGSGGPYIYKISVGNDIYDFINPYVLKFTNPKSADVNIQISDKSGIISSKIYCGKLNVNKRDLTLKIGPSGNQATLGEYRVKVGSSFGLKWSDTLPTYSKNYVDSSNNPDGYICTKSHTPSTNSGWQNSWDGNIEKSGSINNLPTNEVGKFVFQINCTSSKLESKQASVILNVIKTTEKEI